ncbi:MAG: methionyl-tRNA formyltransferase [Thermodesulfobacteriota bacterium]
MRPLRIVFMGTPEFSVPSLERLLQAGFDVAAVVTRPEKPRGRGQAVAPSRVKEFALKRGLPVLEPSSITHNAEFLAELNSIKPDVMAVVAYGRILPQEILSVPPMGCVNVHASILPFYRGASPINMAIMNGDKSTGVSTMLMDRGMDTGPALLIEETEIGEDETAGELSERLSLIGAELLVKTLRLLAEGNITPLAQDSSRATFALPLKKEDALIDWSLSAIEIKNKVRGLCPKPGAYTYLKGKVLKIYGGKVLPDTRGAGAGTIIENNCSGMAIKCGKGIFLATELQIEGKKRMSASEFLKGYKIENEVLGK